LGDDCSKPTRAYSRIAAQAATKYVQRVRARAEIIYRIHVVGQLVNGRSASKRNIIVNLGRTGRDR
jgi:hypothetical protein